MENIGTGHAERSNGCGVETVKTKSKRLEKGAKISSKYTHDTKERASFYTEQPRTRANYPSHVTPELNKFKKST